MQARLVFISWRFWAGGGTKGRLPCVIVADSFSVFSEFSILTENFISRFENVWFAVNLLFYNSEN